MKKYKITSYFRVPPGLYRFTHAQYMRSRHACKPVPGMDGLYKVRKPVGVFPGDIIETNVDLLGQAPLKAELFNEAHKESEAVEAPDNQVEDNKPEAVETGKKKHRKGRPRKK